MKVCVELFCVILQKQEPPPTPVKPVVKKENQWFDVGIVKVTNMVVTHFYVPADDSQGDVSISWDFSSIQLSALMSVTLTPLLSACRMTLGSCQTTVR